MQIKSIIFFPLLSTFRMVFLAQGLYNSLKSLLQVELQNEQPYLKS